MSGTGLFDRRHAFAWRAAALVAMLGAFLVLTSGTAAAATVGVVGPVTTVHPKDHPTVSSNVTLNAAPNEFESFQIVVDNTAGAAATGNVTATASALGTIPASNVSLFREEYYTVVRPSDGELGQPEPCPASAAVCTIPDALIPDRDAFYNEQRNAFPFTVPAGENRVIWVDVLVPAGQAPGTYTGSITVSGAAANAVTIPITLQVLSVASLPSTSSLRGFFAADVNQLARTYSSDGTNNFTKMPGGDPINGTRDGAWELYSKFVQAGLNNRITLSTPGIVDPSPGDNLTKFRIWAEPYLTGAACCPASVIPPVTGAPTPGPKLAQAKLTDVVIDRNHTSDPEHVRSEGVRDGFLDKITFYCDEVAQDATKWNTLCDSPYKTALTEWNKGTDPDPPLPAALAGTRYDYEFGQGQPSFTVDDAMNTLIPSVVRMDVKQGWQPYPGQEAQYPRNQRDAYNNFLSVNGRRLWLYASCLVSGCDWAWTSDPNNLYTGWPSYHIDQPPSEARAMGWQVFNYKATGEQYFETMKNLPSAWSSCPNPMPSTAPSYPTGYCLYNEGGNGDGTLFYPGKACAGAPPCVGGSHGIPIESIRLKRIRDGREDYELLLQAKNVDEAKTRAISGGPYGSASGLFPAENGDGSGAMYKSDTQTDADFNLARCRLAALISKTGTVCAGYPRPKGATPLRVALVPAFNQCVAPNRTHGAPLAAPSCTPPAQSSSYLTVGSPDSNGAGANSNGSVLYSVLASGDVRVTTSITDVRCRATSGGCAGGALTDYKGQVEVASSVRITDGRNGTSGTRSGTVQDTTFLVKPPVPCAETTSTTIGGTCSSVTTFNAVVPGTVASGERAIWELGQVVVNDGGADGVVSTTPNNVFARQGFFVP